MSNNITGYLIDPYERTIVEIDIDITHGLADICAKMECEYVEAINVANTTDVILIDEEARITKDIMSENLWTIMNFRKVLIGKAIVLGITKAGDFKSPRVSIHDVTKSIIFIDRPLKEMHDA